MFLYELLLSSLSKSLSKNCPAQEALDEERQTLIVIMPGQSEAHVENEGFSV